MKRRESVSEGLDRYGRWRSDRWLHFVRSLPCRCGDLRCPNCVFGKNASPVVAAHLRNRDGIGVKPDDFLAYPLSNKMHQIFHSHGQPSVARQLEMVKYALREGLRRGVLKIEQEIYSIPF